MEFDVAQFKPENTLIAQMPIDISVNDDGMMLVFHGKDFEGQVTQIEYEQDSGEIYFLFDNGGITAFGMPAPQKSRKHMEHAHEAQLARGDTHQRTAGDLSR